MADNAQMTAADAADRHRSRVAVAALSMAFMFLTRAVMHVVEPALANNLDYLGAGFALLAVGLVIPSARWKFQVLSRMPKGERDAYFSPDGFVNDIFNQAQRVSWTATFFLLLMLDIVVFDKNSSGYLATLPIVFYFQALLGVMLGVMATTFLILNRADGADDAEDGVRA